MKRFIRRYKGQRQLQKEQQEEPTLYEAQVMLNEKCYQIYLDSIDTLKMLIHGSQKQYEQTNDPKLKKELSKTIKDTKQDLLRLERRKPQVIAQYHFNKRYLESLRQINNQTDKQSDNEKYKIKLLTNSQQVILKSNNKEEYLQQRKQEYIHKQKQKKHLIEINDETLMMFKTVSSLMNEENFLTYDDILTRVLDHWQQCTEVEIDRY